MTHIGGSVIGHDSAGNITIESSQLIERTREQLTAIQDSIQPIVNFQFSGDPTTQTFLRNISTFEAPAFELPTSIFDTLRTNVANLIGLGEASIQISSALNENITIREQQRAIDTEAVRNQQIQINTLNERLSSQLQELGESFSNIGSGDFDPIKFFTDNPLIGGIGIGGLAVGAVVLLLVLK